MPPAAAAKCVAAKAQVANRPAAKALPALKPNQPTHSIAGARAVYVRLCGGIGSLAVTQASAQQQGANQGRHARTNVDHRSAGKVQRRRRPKTRPHGGCRSWSIPPPQIQWASGQ